MDVETELNAEIEQLEYAANFLKARANAAIKYNYDSCDYDFERANGFAKAAEYLTAADKLQGRANMLSNFGRDYRPSEFADEASAA